jgi:hypothetical protein
MRRKTVVAEKMKFITLNEALAFKMKFENILSWNTIQFLGREGVLIFDLR